MRALLSLGLFAFAQKLGRGIDVPVHPANCRSGKAKRCYTADVSVVISWLSGASGHEPGVAAPSHVDEYGRAMFQSGFGTGVVRR